MKIPMNHAAHSTRMALHRTLLLGMCISIFLLGAAAQCAWPVERDPGQPNLSVSAAGADVSASPQKLYESISAYQSGMHGKRDSKETKTSRPAKKRQTPTILAFGEEPSLRRTMVAQEDLAVKRLGRHERDAAVLALDRALKASLQLAAADESGRLKEMQ